MDVMEKLVELIRCADYHPCRGAVRTIGSMFTTEFIEDIASQLIDNSVTVQEWIPVTERLPEVGQKCLIANSEIVARGWLRPDGVWKTGVSSDEIWSKFSLHPPTHWMPLPKPPKGE